MMTPGDRLVMSWCYGRQVIGWLPLVSVFRVLVYRACIGIWTVRLKRSGVSNMSEEATGIGYDGDGGISFFFLLQRCLQLDEKCRTNHQFLLFLSQKTMRPVFQTGNHGPYLEGHGLNTYITHASGFR